MSHYHEECRYCGCEWWKNQDHKEDCPLYRKVESKGQEPPPPRKPLQDGYPYCA